MTLEASDAALGVTELLRVGDPVKEGEACFAVNTTATMPAPINELAAARGRVVVPHVRVDR